MSQQPTPLKDAIIAKLIKDLERAQLKVDRIQQHLDLIRHSKTP